MLLNFIDTCTTRPSRLFYYFPDGETKTITAATRKMIFFFFYSRRKMRESRPGLRRRFTQITYNRLTETKIPKKEKQIYIYVH